MIDDSTVELMLCLAMLPLRLLFDLVIFRRILREPVHLDGRQIADVNLIACL